MGDNPNNVRDIASRFKGAGLDEIESLVARYANDPREGVRRAVAQARRRMDSHRRIAAHTHEMYVRMRELGGTGHIVGLDEVGRGAVAGPLTVAAVSLPDEPEILGLDDSKRLSPKQREELARQIRECGAKIGIFHVAPEEIDRSGMARCLKLAMKGALEDLGFEPDSVLIDGNPVHVHPRERCIVKGDAKIACIATASIVAKVTRDRLMVLADSEYPGYFLAQSKGYASPEHIDALRKMGTSAFHRKTFCTGLISEQISLF